MPILLAPEPGAPLDQGDLLEGLTLAWSNGEGAVDAATGKGLVISRPCNATRESLVQVAVVVETTLNVKALLADGTSLESLRRRIDAVRDGDGSPDRFYLGPMLGNGNRLTAKLNHIVTVGVPEKEARPVWVEKHRVARLDQAFRRDLHVRLFASIARQGFSDCGWYADKDLKIIVAHAEGIVSRMNAEKAGFESNLHGVEGGAPQVSGFQKKIDALAKKIEKAEMARAPYAAEFERRGLT